MKSINVSIDTSKASLTLSSKEGKDFSAHLSAHRISVDDFEKWATSPSCSTVNEVMWTEENADKPKGSSFFTAYLDLFGINSILYSVTVEGDEQDRLRELAEELSTSREEGQYAID